MFLPCLCTQTECGLYAQRLCSLQKGCLQRAKARGGVRAAAALFGRGDIGSCEDPDAYCWEHSDPDDYDLVQYSSSRTRGGQQSRLKGASQQRVQRATSVGLVASAAPATLSTGLESSGAEAESAVDALATAVLAEENGLEETRRAAWRQARRVSMQTFFTGCFLCKCSRVIVPDKGLT